MAAGFTSCAVGQSAGPLLVLDHEPDQLVFNTNGAVVAWSSLFERSLDASAGEVRFRGRILKLESPRMRHEGAGLAFSYHWAAEPALEVTVRHEIGKDHGILIWRREIEVGGQTNLDTDLMVSVQSWPRLPNDTWLPLLNGTGSELGTNAAAAFRFAGAVPAESEWLALPMVSIPARTPDRRILVAADPYFSSRFTRDAVEWTYQAKGGLENGCEKRTVILAVQEGGVDHSLQCFFKVSLPEVAPGPAWLHEIALVDFDYLSDGGQGWFRDIDRLTAALSRKERRQALLCVHGWYDFLGRYCFDSQTRKLDREWTSFSSYETARNAPQFGPIGGERVPVGFGNCKPVKMSLSAVHARLQYARQRGYRTGLYYADGVNAGDGLPDFTPDRVLQWGGWQGPDSKGKSYFQNPLHPKVRQFFLDYTRALLQEFGSETDALVWDETFHVPCGKLGTETWPGYADRAMMRLVRDVTAVVEQYNHEHGRQIALMTSDCLGAVYGSEIKAPYALVAQGTFQDSWCQPRAWSYGIFANYRNVLWSCCWWPINKWSWVEFGVRQYQAPVSLSNGWGNDTGFSEMSAAQQAKVIELFNWRKNRPTKLKWFRTLPEFSEAK